MTRRALVFTILALSATLLGCEDEPPVFEEALSPVHTELTYVKDEQGRYVHFHGVNVSGTSKVPRVLDVPLPNGRDWSFVGRPFPEDEADTWMADIRAQGFNAIRLIFLWESVFPDAYGVPDEDFLDYFEAVIAAADRHGIYVLLNLHENLWGRQLWANFNEKAPGLRGDIDNMLFSLLPCDPDEGPENCQMSRVIGDGAPAWATKICLPEKNFDSPHWGTHHLVGRLAEKGNNARWSYALTLFDALNAALEIIDTSTAEARADYEDMLDSLQRRLEVQGVFDYTESTDLLPLSGWWENTILSLDISRCYAQFFGGDQIFPDRVVEDGVLKWRDEAEDPESAPDIKTYLQSSWIDAWREIARRAAPYPNVVGYDLINEPALTSVMLTVVALYFELGGFDETVKDVVNLLLNYDISDYVGLIDAIFPALADPTAGPCNERCGLDESALCGAACDEGCDAVCGDPEDPQNDACFALCARQVAECQARRASCTALLDSQVETCVDYCRDPDRDEAATKLVYLLKFLEMLPPDTSDETRRKWGMEGIDAFATIGLNDAFDVFYLQPLFEATAAAILEEDDEATIWVTSTGNGGLQGGTWMTLPENIEGRGVFAPHWYPDIYPFFGFNMVERDFSVEEVRHRDYTADLAAGASSAAETLSNIPVVYGEFGTYWNYKVKGMDWEGYGAEQSREIDYRISAEILDNYYEAFETLGMSSFLWCYSVDNERDAGDGWNHEDFSVLDENREPRGASAWARPYARALSGKPLSSHFYSDHHYYDPDKGEPDPWHEYEVVFASKESEAPSILVVPPVQYPEGFYVWLSDGWAAWDAAHNELYIHPERDEPGWQHRVLIRPPIEGQDVTGWDYFIHDDRVVSGR